MRNESLILQFERVKRHYDVSIKTFDKISFLDLSNSLRIWCDMKDEITESDYPLIRDALFSYCSPSQNQKKVVNGSNFIWFALPRDGVFTYAHNGSMQGTNNPKMISLGLYLKRDPDGKLWINNGYYLDKRLGESNIKSNVMNKYSTQKVKYSYWLGTELVRLSLFDERTTTSISREMMVRRVANTMDGSHPRRELVDSNNRFDKYIENLTEYTCSGLPLPYFLLLSIAKEIVEVFPKILFK